MLDNLEKCLEKSLHFPETRKKPSLVRLSSQEIIAKLRDQQRKSIDFIEKRAKKQVGIIHKVFCMCVSVDTKEDWECSAMIPQP